jgi:hypothetical protein
MLYYSTARLPRFAFGETGGADPDRTGDPLLAKQVLSQLSYSPPFAISNLKFEIPSGGPR